MKLKHDFSHIHQSPWIGDILNKYMPEVGYFVEIGVGHTTTPESRKSGLTTVVMYGTNTGDLINMGWSGIYIEPVKEFCDEARLLFKDNLDRLKIINVGASDIEEETTMYGCETMIPSGIPENFLLNYNDFATNKPYKYPGTRVKCYPTSSILEENNCPKTIDFMSIDVEKYEEKVIRGINFEKHQPNLLVVETNPISPAAINALLPNKYSIIQSDNLNTCWIRNFL